MAATPSKSFREQLKGAISDFLGREEMPCYKTEEAILELVVALSSYTEEGTNLFPRILICDELHETLRILNGRNKVPIGREAGQVEKRCLASRKIRQ